jgi:hypothetical protein
MKLIPFKSSYILKGQGATQVEWLDAIKLKGWIKKGVLSVNDIVK